MSELVRNEVGSTRQVLDARMQRIPPAEAIVAEYEQVEVSEHAFFVGLRGRPVDLGAIWVLMANLRAGISRDFVVWLAQTVARVDDRRIGSLLAKQLNDELGHGDFGQIHSVLLDRFVAGLEPWRPGNVRDEMLLPGRRLAEQATVLFRAPDPFEAVGALVVGEIFAKKMDRCVGDEIRRQEALSAETLTWLTVHEVLEVDHADDSGELAALVPNVMPILEATWRGATAQWRILWDFLDGVQSVSLD